MSAYNRLLDRLIASSVNSSATRADLEALKWHVARLERENDELRAQNKNLQMPVSA